MLSLVKKNHCIYSTDSVENLYSYILSHMDEDEKKETEEVIELNRTPILLKDLGMRYPTENSKQKKRYGLYQCQYCGKEFETQTNNVNTGHTLSCGCLQGKHIIHGMYQHRIFKTWSGMKSRCYNMNHTEYKNYGARGIGVCERWLDVGNFIEDMFPSYQEGLSLDRIDVNGNYEPDNCRWATQSTQMRNTRDILSRNKSGFRGVSYNTRNTKWVAHIRVDTKSKYLGSFKTPLEAAKAYERYVRLNNLEHNFTPALTEEEIEELKQC